MNRHFVISLILFAVVICSPFYLPVCSAQANGDASTPTFELNLEPADPTAWEDWRPEYKTNTSFVATLKGETETGQAIRIASVTYTFTLDSSEWPGICMNANGDDDTGRSVDLFFREEDNQSGSGQTFTVTSVVTVPGETNCGSGLTVSGTGITTVIVSVRVNDYAAVGILSVSAAFNYEDPLSGSTSSSSSEDDDISIPWDNNGNDIADGWEDDDIHDYNPWDDTETGPGSNSYTGDGFTVFEEYRGFYVRGSHTPIFPTDKDVFIYSELAEGIGDASGLPTPIVKHEINYDEAKNLPDPNGLPLAPGTEDPWVNFNPCGGILQVVNQNALWVDSRPANPNASTLMGLTDALGPVHDVDWIRIYEDVISDMDADMETERAALKVGLLAGVSQTGSTRISQIISLTIGHEIGHGVGLYHPFDEILISERADIPRPRYHDRLRYNTTYCQYESENPYRFPTARHGSPQMCGTSISVWDSGSTIMDYGSETLRIQLMGNDASGNGYTLTSAGYLAGFTQSTTYLARLHTVEYMFVSPSVAAAHAAKPLPDPLRDPKPQWEPPVSDSTEISSGTDTAPPDAPYGLNAAYGNGQVRLSWTAGGGTTTDYQYRYRVSGGSWGDWISALLSNTEVLSDTEVLILSLINGTTYEFHVRAMNGESASAATESSESTPATVPGKPTSLSGYGYNGWVSLSWTAPSDNGGADISDYEYQYSRTSQSFGSSWTSWGNTNTLNSVFGLTNGTGYKFRIRAVNSAGESTESRTAYATPVTVPGIPQNVTSTAGDGEVFLYWDASNSNGGSTITDYEYSYREGSSGDFGSWTSAGTDQWERVTGLTNDTSYEFRVRARNRIGPGTSAGPIEATPEVPAVAPDAPTDLSASYGDGQISLSWTAPSSSGSSAITHYEYRYATGIYPNHSAFTEWASTGSTSTSYVVTGLTNGTQHLLQVRAVNSERASSASNTAFQTPFAPATALSAPRNLGTLRGDGQVILFWTAPSSSGSSTITHYEYRYATGRYPNHSAFTEWASTGSTSTLYLVTGLTNGTPHLFQVRAVNSVGASSASNTAFQTPLASATVPSAPTGLSVGSSNGQTRLTWTAPSNGGSSITDYEYRYRENNTGSWGSWISAGDTSTGENIPGLTSGTLYGFQVRAVNGVGESEVSNTATGTAR